MRHTSLTHIDPRSRVSRLAWPALAGAGLLALLWSAGYHLGKTGTGIRMADTAGREPALREKEARSALPAAVSAPEAVTPASTAALLETTLQRLRAIPRGNNFMTKWEEARIVAELSEMETPRLLALVDALLEVGGFEAEEMAGRLLGPVLQPRDPAAVWNWLRDGAGTGNETRLRFLSGTAGVFGAWAARDPEAALAAWNRDAVPMVQAGKLNDDGFASIFREWAAARPESALAAARQLTDPAARARAAEAVATGLGKVLESAPSTWPGDAPALLESVLAFAGDQAAGALYGMVRGRLREETPAEVAAWAERLPLTWTQKAAFQKTMLDTWMPTDAPAAADWYLATVPAESATARDRALERIIRKWTRVDEPGRNSAPPDPAAASDWLNARGLGPESQAAMTTLARAWGQAREPEAALAWARALPEETARVRAVEAVTEEIRQRFPNDWRRLTGQ